VATNGELDVVQLVGHSVAVVRVCVAEEVFAGSEEPVEGDDGKVDDVGPAHAKLRVLAVEHFEEGLKDSDVDGVGARGRAVFLLSPLQYSTQEVHWGGGATSKECLGHLGSDPPNLRILLHVASISPSTVEARTALLQAPVAMYRMQYTMRKRCFASWLSMESRVSEHPTSVQKVVQRSNARSLDC
jgi:hypothetical protein